MNLYGDQMITGCMTDFIKGIPRQRIMWNYLILMTIVFYLFVWILYKNQIVRSIAAHSDHFFCIIAVNIGGYFFNMIYTNLITSSISSPITAWFGHIIAVIPLNIGAASNGPILFLTSTDYRQAFKKQLPFVFKQISNPNQAIPLQQQQNGHPMQLVTINSVLRHLRI